jgi:hypothetical protein
MELRRRHANVRGEKFASGNAASDTYDDCVRVYDRLRIAQFSWHVRVKLRNLIEVLQERIRELVLGRRPRCFERRTQIRV